MKKQMSVAILSRSNLINVNTTNSNNNDMYDRILRLRSQIKPLDRLHL